MADFIPIDDEKFQGSLGTTPTGKPVIGNFTGTPDQIAYFKHKAEVDSQQSFIPLDDAKPTSKGFIALDDTPPSKGFGPMDYVKQFGKGVTGTLAAGADMVSGIPGMIQGGLVGAGSLPMGADKAQENMTKWTPPTISQALIELGVPEDWLHNRSYDLVNKPFELLHEASQKFGATLSDHATSNVGRAGAALSSAAIELAAMLLGAKAAGKGVNRATQALTDRTTPVPTPRPSTLADDLRGGNPEATTQAAGQRPAPLPPDTLASAGLDPRRNVQGSEVPMDTSPTLETPEQASLRTQRPTPLEMPAVEWDKDTSPDHLSNFLGNKPEPPRDPNINPEGQEADAWARYNLHKEDTSPDLAGTPWEKWQPSQSGPTMQKMQAPISNRRTRNQSGAIDASILAEIPKFGKYVVDTLMKLPNKSFITAEHVKQAIGQMGVNGKEKELIQDVMGDSKGMPAKEFAQKVGEKLVPLKIEKIDQYANYGLDHVGDPHMQPSEFPTQYTAMTHLWDLPEAHSISNHFDDPNYFAHTRVFDDMSGTRRNITELQSDTMQHMHSLSEADKQRYEQQLEEVNGKRDQAGKLFDIVSSNGEHPNARDIILDTVQDIHHGLEDNLMFVSERYRRIGNNHPSINIANELRLMLEDGRYGSFSDAIIYEESRRRVVKEALMGTLDRLDAYAGDVRNKLASAPHEQLNQFSPKDWWKRIIREEVFQGVKDGKQRMSIALPDTIAKIEGWQRNEYRDISDGELANLDIQRGEFTYQEHKGIYDWYRKDVIPWIKKEYNAKEVEIAGHKYLEWELDPTQAKVQAFGNKSQSKPSALGGVGKKEGGAINFFGSSKPQPQANPDAVLRYAYEQAKTPTEFKWQLAIAHTDPVTRQGWLADADRLWAEKDQHLASTSPLQGPQSKVDLLHGMDTRQTPDVLDEYKSATEGKPIRDVTTMQRIGNTVNSSSYRSVFMNMDEKALNAPETRLVKHVDDKAQLDNELATYLKNRQVENVREWKKYAKTKEDELQINDQANWIEENPTAWFDPQNPGNYYPTMAQLMSMGKSLTPNQAKAYLAKANIWSGLWDIIDVANARQGKAPVPRIPGYLSHVTQGPYTIMVEMDTGGGNWQLSWKRGKFNMTDAGELLKDVKAAVANDPTLRIRLQDGYEIGKPKIGQVSLADLAMDMQHVVEIASNNNRMAGLAKFFGKLQESAQQGLLKQALDRNLNINGHDAQVVARARARGERVDPELERRVAELAIRMHDYGVDFYRQLKFLQDTYQPIADSGILKDRPNLRTSVENMTNTFIGNDAGWFKSMGNLLEQLLVDRGKNPGLLNAANNFAVQAFSIPVLKYNTGFHVQNVVQISDVIHQLFQVVDNSGTGPKGSVIRALMDASKSIKDAYSPENLGKNDFLTQEGRRMGAADMNFAHSIERDGFDPAGKLLTGIEARNRLMSFHVGYNYFKQIMPHEQALNAAKSFADATMVPYGEYLGRSMVSNRLGTIGGLFTQYMFHELGRVVMDFKNLATGTKSFIRGEGGISGIAGPARTIGVSLLQKWALWGVLGWPMMNTIDAMLRAYNTISNGEQVDSIREWVRKNVPEQYHLRFISDVGLLAGATDLDITGSGSGVSVGSAGLGVAQFGVQALKVMHMTIQEVLARTMDDKWYDIEEKVHGSRSDPLLPYTASEWNDAVKKLPFKNLPVGGLLLEQALQSKNWDDFVDRTLGGHSTTTERGTLNKLYPRSPQETLMKFITGRGSVKEAEQTTDYNLTRSKQANEQQLRDKYESHLLDWYNGNRNLSESQRNFMMNWLTGHNYTLPESVMQSVTSGIIKRNVPYEDREGLNLRGGGLPGVRRYEIGKEYENTNPTRKRNE